MRQHKLNTGKHKLVEHYTMLKRTKETPSRLAEGPNASSSELRHCVRVPSRKKKHFFSLPVLAGPIGNVESLGPVGGLG